MNKTVIAEHEDGLASRRNVKNKQRENEGGRVC